MLKAVLFDLDGTVGDTLALCVEAFRAAMEPMVGYPLSDGEILGMFGPNDEGTIRNLVHDRWEEGVASYLSYYRKLHVRYPEPFPGVLDLLKLLKGRGLVLGMVTGKGAESCRITLEQYGMDGLFDMVETGSPLGPCKPRGIKAILDRFHLSTDEAVYVGDVSADIDAAREVGVKIIAVAYASTAKPDKLRAKKPDFLCFSVAELETALGKLAVPGH